MPHRLVQAEEWNTYRDYETWPEDERYELVRGVPYMMSSPGLAHQNISKMLFRQIDAYLAGKKCQAFYAPFDVRLFPREDGSDDTVVQPDLFVVCDEAKLSDGKSCRGAPDFIIEIVSESTRRMDLLVKRNLYLKAGVREYWVVDGDTLYTYVLRENAYEEVIYGLSGGVLEIKAEVFDMCVLKLERTE